MKSKCTKYLVLSIIMSVFFTGLYAQNVKGNGRLISTTRSVSSFDELGVGGSFDVVLKKGNSRKVELTVEENLEPYLVTEVKGGKLNIHWKKGARIKTTKKTKLLVYFNALKGVGLSGSGDIKSTDMIKGEALSIAVAGSGDISLLASTNRIKTAVSGSGDIVVSGKTDEFEAAVAGSGDIKAIDLSSKRADMRISGSGGISITVNEEILARISGSGDIKYRGNPRIEDVKVSGSGKVSAY